MSKVIPEVRQMSDEELADVRHALGNRVMEYQCRAEEEGPNAGRDANAASYEALLSMVDAERERRAGLSLVELLSNADRPFAGARVPHQRDGEHLDRDGSDVHETRLVLIPGVDLHALSLVEAVA